MKKQGLYDPRNEHDACGVGFVVNIDGTASHGIVERAIQVLDNLVHRGAAGGDGQTGDGAGVIIQVPHAFFQRETSGLGITLPPAGQYGVGCVFLPRDKKIRKECENIIEEIVSAEGCNFLGWREVPVDSSALGQIARDAQPDIAQCFIGSDDLDSFELERKLYLIRRQIELQIEEQLSTGDTFYIPSLSCHTILYKGMMMGGQVSRFYKELDDPDVVSAIGVLHQRYSTNTFPSWKLSQPFRFLAHNGEINTLRGNLNHMRSREKQFASELFGRDLKKLLPVIDEEGSDSSSLDNALEFLVAGGRDLAHAMMMLIPQAWGSKYPIGPDLRGFFEYHAGIMEPWDGPAAVAFTDGSQVGALLDRNGLRPARYTITKDGFMVLASETGVLDIDQANVVEKGILSPGEMILVDLKKKRVLKNGEIKSHYARQRPYRRWVDENKIVLHGLFNDIAPVKPDTGKLFQRHKVFGYTREDLQMIIAPMASSGHEPVGSMGFDSPPAVLSENNQLLYNYFRQLFAQVTNPPIDSIREELVMSLMTFMGTAPNILKDDPRNARLIKLLNPILSNEDTERIKKLNMRHFNTTVISIGFPGDGGQYAFEESLEKLCNRAESAAADRRSLIILSDKDLPSHVAPIPALLAVSAVNRRLVKKGLRTSTSLIVETGEAREVHHMALLLGYGATAINPYLAFETIADMADSGTLDNDIGVTRALENYIKSICKGLLKIMSKMGISTLRSYRSAQVFEAIGLEDSFVEKYFAGTASRIGGIGLAEVYEEVNVRFKAAQTESASTQVLPSGGYYRFRKDGERHLWTPDTISKLQLATKNNDLNLYKEYSALINDQAKKQSTFRGLFKFKKAKSVSIDEVEPVEEIVKRFVTSAMSFGSISREAHETLAIAMNRIGGMSNSGEGGEDPERYKPLPNGDSKCSAVKQIASGRFGVTIEYLVSSRELQIKIAQGAKPGEGGQLPGHKVNEEIAKVRHATPGVTLISPPPHHDIYSIEDIKQLIFDLKNANPKARVSVKLVSEVGVGTVAAGVAKGHADMVLISGGDGGTGAAPLSSIKYGGVPWELGLSETHQTLVLNNLRDRIRVQADGQMKTGRDIIIACMLGAEEFGFATAPLVVCGCVMMRKCHQNTCPVGVATQDPELRKRFYGKADYVVNFMHMIAGEVREIMAELGFKTMDEMVGRRDLLEVNEAVNFWKARGLDFSKILGDDELGGHKLTVRCVKSQKHAIDDVLDKDLIVAAKEALEDAKKVELDFPVRNVNRTVGTMLSGELARRYGGKGLPEDTVTCRFTGAAGQSFGAFAISGMTMILEGEANDYLGKGLSGGKIIVKPYENASFNPAENVICGNVLLYGATSGELFINGKAGERFAIRNSGVNTVVEGVGDHGCEYMTGGRVVVLGDTGVNFAAGMSGGIAYVYDPRSIFDANCNLDMIDLELVDEQGDVDELKSLIGNHLKYTGSEKAKYILENWEASVPLFVKVFPTEYRRVLGQMMKEDEATEREEVEAL